MKYIWMLLLGLMLCPMKASAERTIEETDRYRLELYVCSLAEKTVITKMNWTLAPGFTNAFEYTITTYATIYAHPDYAFLTIWAGNGKRFDYTVQTPCAITLYKAVSTKLVGGNLEVQVLHNFLDQEEAHE